VYRVEWNSGSSEGRTVAITTGALAEQYVPQEIVASVFHGAAVTDALAILVVENDGTATRVSWGNQGAVKLLGYGLEDLRSLPIEQLLPSLRGSELRLLLRRERAGQMSLPVRTASGAFFDTVIIATPTPSGQMWTLRIITTSNDHEKALRATADAHERRFSTLTERSPIPTLLSEQGMRLAHVNDAFCALVGWSAEQLLGTGWMGTVHPDDLDVVVEQVAAVLDGGDGETQARLVRDDGTVRTTVIRFAHLFTPGVGAGFVGTIEDITDRLAFEARLAH
jgi:PAS domain S-box-containing protein